MVHGKETRTPTKRSRRLARKVRPNRSRKNRSTNKRKKSLKSKKMIYRSEVS